MSDLQPMASGVDSSSVESDAEVRTALRDTELEIVTRAETPSPATMVSSMSIRAPTPSPLKRPPPPPPRPSPSKRQRAEEMQVQLLEQQVKYYQLKNEELKKRLSAIEETKERDVEVECRLQAVERAVGYRE